MKEAATDNTMRRKGGTMSRRHLAVDNRAKGKRRGRGNNADNRVASLARKRQPHCNYCDRTDLQHDRTSGGHYLLGGIYGEFILNVSITRNY